MHSNTLFNILRTHIILNRNRDFHERLKIAYSHFGKWWTHADVQIESKKELHKIVDILLLKLGLESIHVHLSVYPIDTFSDYLHLTHIQENKCCGHHFGTCSINKTFK